MPAARTASALPWTIASPMCSAVPAPPDGIEAGGTAAFLATVGVALPALFADSFGVDGDDDTLAAEALGALGDKLGVLDGGGVDGYLVGPRLEHEAHVLGGADAAADG